MNIFNINDEMENIEFDKLLSIFFIIASILNIAGDDILIKAIDEDDDNLRKEANNIFLIGLIITFILNLILVAQNYDFYIQKKESGQNADPELIRLIGSILVLIGFCLIFYYFIITNLGEEGTPVL